ncbi:conserved hypothetical protein [Trichinella spiralis]|uniref:hypothetical protein n=1 Tax=Trichinella spiralis TaxID=6334 RepID=UPI0001EFE737|nr:conserved hypothetical protein [Trichinella spiralis]
MTKASNSYSRLRFKAGLMINQAQLTSSRLHISTRKGQKLITVRRFTAKALLIDRNASDRRLVPLPKIVRSSRSVIDGTLPGEPAVVLYPPRLMSIDTSKSLTDWLGLVEDVPNCI